MNIENIAIAAIMAIILLVFLIGCIERKPRQGVYAVNCYNSSGKLIYESRDVRDWRVSRDGLYQILDSRGHVSLVWNATCVMTRV